MSEQEASVAIGNGAEAAIDFGDQFADQRLAARAVGGAVGVFVMPPLGLAAEKHADEFFDRLPRFVAQLSVYFSARR